MIALLTSTVYPPDRPVYGTITGQRSVVSGEERLEQTRRSVESLLDVGIRDIVVADNSGERWQPGAAERLAPATVHVFDQHQYDNKGISELHLLRAVLPRLPDGEPILKLSGRYTVSRDLSGELGSAQVAGRFYRDRLGRATLSTRCYLVRDRRTMETLVQRTLREVYGYASRVVGLRSLLRIARNSLLPALDDYPYEDPPIAIEFALARVLRTYRYDVRELALLGVEGTVAGNPQDVLKE